MKIIFLLYSTFLLVNLFEVHISLSAFWPLSVSSSFRADVQGNCSDYPYNYGFLGFDTV
jgi:hypothetical protein